MVNHRTRKTERQSWSQHSMGLAIKSVKEKKMGYLEASKTFGIPKTTLIRRVMDKKQIRKRDKQVFGKQNVCAT